MIMTDVHEPPQERSKEERDGVLPQVEVDQELVAAAKRGERGAFDVLVRKYQGRIMRLVSRYVRQEEDAYDVVQEVFVKAYRAIQGFREESAFYTWLYRIASNTAKNHAMTQARSMVRSEADLPESLVTEEGLQTSDADTPESLILSQEAEAIIGRAVSELPEELRRALLLREVEGLSYEEIAVAMDCPIGTVRSRLFRARAWVEQALANR
jgi:RNA polymerase sigma-70 factor (ECF subfamily)